MHIMSLPHELLLRIVRWTIGDELDLFSLQQLSMVSRGFYALSRDQILWRSICHKIWGREPDNYIKEYQTSKLNDDPQIDWIKMYKKRPRLNFNGLYMNRTRYIRPGDFGFEDLTYRPFHAVRYYRYFRFFTNKKVLIMTSNEEPDRIIPIFRNALDASHFSTDLSVIEGQYELNTDHMISIVAEKDGRAIEMASRQRQGRYQLSRQTPLNQKFLFKFSIETNKHKQGRNNSLRWLEYTIISTFDTEKQETTMDLSDETFPSLQFHKIKQFTYKINRPLPD